MTFRAGQKVVCIDAGMGAIDASRDLVHGKVYEVTVVRIDATNRLVLGLAGVCFQWRATRFRPVVERKTDISIFTAMLKEMRKPVVAGAAHE